MNHLPLTHPEYRYSASRNPYWEKNRALGGRIFADNDGEANRGRWREVLGGRTELHVEIGCNAGHVVVEWAARNPGRAYLGLDYKHKAVFRAAEKAAKRGAENVKFVRAHAERIQFMFGPGEIDRLCLFFPDPWAKKSQYKNRFLTAARLTELAKIVAPGGEFHIRTDHAGYFEWMEAAVKEVPEHWDVLERSADLHADNPERDKLEIPDVTLFEKLFIRDGIPINSLKLRRR